LQQKLAAAAADAGVQLLGAASASHVSGVLRLADDVFIDLGSTAGKLFGEELTALTLAGDAVEQQAADEDQASCAADCDRGRVALLGCTVAHEAEAELAALA